RAPDAGNRRSDGGTLRSRRAEARRALAPGPEPALARVRRGDRAAQLLQVRARPVFRPNSPSRRVRRRIALRPAKSRPQAGRKKNAAHGRALRAARGKTRDDAGAAVAADEARG